MAALYLVHRLVGRMRAPKGELVLLQYREGYRNVETVAELGMNASAVATKLANAIAKMRAAHAGSLPA